MYNAPIYVMNKSAKREQGREAQRSNIKAARAVADVVRTTLGPRSMLKMLLDPMGGIVLTNDGNAILREVNPDYSYFIIRSMLTTRPQNQ
jgi:T-complex protein 1 subunit gamma